MDEDVDLDAVSFGTDGWRAPLAEFTEPRVRAVGRAVAAHLDDAGTAGPVLVGYDARERSPDLAAALAETLAAAGREVVLATRDLPTPALAWGVHERDAAGALTITASHNPPSYNGVKLLGPAGAPALPETTDAVADRLGRRPSADGGRVARADLIGPYLDDALAFVDRDLDGLAVAYDALHGSGRGVTDELLSRAGAAVERHRCERDPSFGGGAPDPSAETLDALAATVRAGEATLGLANDGDADRLVVVTPQRGVLDGNATFALLYDHLLADATGPAVRTVSTTALIDRIAAAHGAETVETAVGFKWVAEAMAETDALVGGEESGGYAVRGRPRNKDGVLGALLVAAAAAEEPLDDRLDRIGDAHGRPATGKISLDCPDDAKPAVLDDLADALPETGTVAGRAVVETTTADGFKLALVDGSWLLVRPSGTEPKVRLYAEADDDDRLAALLEAGRGLVGPLIP